MLVLKSSTQLILKFRSGTTPTAPVDLFLKGANSRGKLYSAARRMPRLLVFVYVLAVLTANQVATQETCDVSACKPFEEALNEAPLNVSLDKWCRASIPYISCLENLPTSCKTDNVKYEIRTTAKAQEDNNCKSGENTSPLSGARNIAVTATFLLALSLLLTFGELV